MTFLIISLRPSSSPVGKKLCRDASNQNKHPCVQPLARYNLDLFVLLGSSCNTFWGKKNTQSINQSSVVSQNDS